MIFAHITTSFRETFHARASEWALAAVLFNWGLVLSLNMTLFEGASYAELAALAPQVAWAWLCLLFGAFRLAVLAINGAWRRSPHIRSACAFVACFVWFQISMGLLQSGTWSTGLAVYPVLFFLDIFNVIRAIGEAGRSDAQHQRMAGNGSDS
ncbi:MAG: hypothetical protein PS018_26445 [bacterium]|nr:hypothetical protein [bacterium]